MRTMLRVLKMVLLLLVVPMAANASHIYGADFYYTYLGNDQYRVTMDFYGDCSGFSFPSLQSSYPGIEVYDTSNNNFLLRYMRLQLTDAVEVTPVCSAQVGQTTCTDVNFPVQGVKRFRYSDTITISHKSTGWTFRFQGNMQGSSAGRSNSIDNIFFGNNGSLTVMTAELNNTVPGSNSSPQFTTIPTPFYCINIAQQYNQGSVDVNGDSLRYGLVHALETTTAQNSPITPVTYRPGYDAQNPLHVLPGTFSFNPANGQMGFTPDAVQQSLVVNKVTEYRNGVMVGSAMREMTFIVRSDCNNVPPAGGITTPVTGGSWNSGSSNVRICQAGGTVSFHIKPTDPEGTKVTLTPNGLGNFPGIAPVVTIAGNNTTNPDLLFSWNVGNVPAGTYTFYVNAKDDGCPQPSQQTQAYTIEVVGRPVLVATVTAPTYCFYKAKLSYGLSSGIPPYTVKILQGSTLLHTFPTITATQLTDSLPAGIYTAEISSPSSGLPCNATYTFTVVDSGTYPFPPVADSGFYCLHAAGAVALSATPSGGGTLKWYDSAGTAIGGAPLPSTATAGIFHWLVTQKVGVCESKPDTAMLYVTKIPTATFTVPDPFCTRDTATIEFTGAVGVGPIIDYQWSWAGANFVAGPMGGPYRVRWDTPGVKLLRLKVLENKCPSSTVVDDILIRPKPYAVFGANDLCAEDTLHVLYNAVPLTGQSYAWTFDGANIPASSSSGPFDLRWESPGRKLLTLKVVLDGCSDSLARTISVHPKPEAGIADLPRDPCLGDKIFLNASGGTSYVWTPKERIFKEPDGRLFTYTMVPAIYTVAAINEFGCRDSAAWAINSIQPCCNFAYPNAFSPNGDGKNDGFRVIMYGNPDRYNLIIFNRWGQKMFQSFDPKSTWDGTFNGSPCEVGTYMYHLKARCMTGREVEQSGDITLVR